MSTATTLLKPGILVGLGTEMRGGVTYQRIDLDAGKDRGDGSHVSRWETIKTVDDPEEYDRATKLRSKVRSLISAECSATKFGLLCRESNETDLDRAIAESTQLCREWNETARTVEISVYVIKGRVAATDEEAARAIGSEVRDLLAAMERGIAEVDIKTIRDAASRAKQIGAILDSSQAARVSVAVEAARKAARELTKRIEKEGEERVKVVTALAPEKAAIEMARFSFLDLDDPEAVSGQQSAGDTMPSVSVQRFGNLEV